MSSRIRFNEAALVENYLYFKNKSYGKTGAVVKANAYGVGASRVTELLVQSECRHFFVASLGEALEIAPFVRGAIYILSGPTDSGNAKSIADAELIPVINSHHQLKLWARHNDLPAAIHVDTGMRRMGFTADRVLVSDFQGFNLCLLMTHLACSSVRDHPMNQYQVDVFDRLAEKFAGIPTSIGNSSGILLGASFQGDVTRPGIGLYGGNPFSDGENPMRTVISCEGAVLQIRSVEKGESIGYDATFVANHDMRVATIGMGYADGIPRALSNRGFVVFQNQRLPIIGRVSMDFTQVDCSASESIKEGEYVEFFGETLPIDEVAKAAETISYELLTKMGRRLAVNSETGNA